MSKRLSRVLKPVINFFIPEAFFTVKKIALSTPTIAAEIPILKKLVKPAIFWMALSEAALVAQLYPAKVAMDSWNQGAGIWTLREWSLAISLIFVLGGFINIKMSCARNRFSEYLGSVILWSEAHRKQLHMDVAWHIEHGTGEKESRIMRNCERVQDFFQSYLFEALKIKLRISFTVIGMLIIMPPFGALACLVFAVYILVLQKIDPVLTPMTKEYHEDLRKLGEFGSELTQNCLTIKSMGKEKYFSWLNREKLMDYYRREVKRHKKWRLLVGRPDHVVNIAKGSVYALGFEISRSGTLVSVGSFVLAIGWMERIFSNLYNLVEFQEKSRRGIPAINELAEIFQVKPSVYSSPNPVWKEGWEGRVEFRNVSFAYDSQTGTTLHNINLTVEPNSLIGIVGKTGCGKSTLLRLLQREYDPESGSILVDDIDICQLDLDRYRQEIVGVVRQDIQLFQDTIRGNIRLSRMDAPAGEEITAAQSAYAEEFILTKPQGYETILGEDGKQLSGGQRQRLGIARALHGKPRILILDEPTSSLDSESQLHVQNALDDLMEQKACTTFIIAHRFSTIRKADLIVVMDKGLIVEIGTHHELVKMNGFYNRMLLLDQEGGLANEASI